MTQRIFPTPLFTAASCVFWMAAAAHAQWTNAAMLSETWERSQGDIKTPQITAAASGGFHAKYFIASPSWQTKYRRYRDNTLQAPVLVQQGAFRSGGDICEALNGDLHMVWEDWMSVGGSDSPEVGWARSANGGTTWSFSRITELRDAKIPQIAPLGTGNPPDVLMSYWQAKQNQMYWERYNGASWSANAAFAIADSEYYVYGTCRSPRDGSVWRAYGRGPGSACQALLRRFDGSDWDPEIVAETTGFFARQSIAANAAGQIMYVWEKDGAFLSKLYTPGAGWGPTTSVQAPATNGHVTAIPGSNKFYIVYVKGDPPNRVRGRMWAGGVWLAEETVSTGLVDAFTVGAKATAGADGTVYACWEYWGGDSAPNAYYSVRPAASPGPCGTIAGIVRDQYAMGVANALVVVPGVDSAVSVSGGTYSMILPVGTYNLSGNKNNFNGDARSNVAVYQGQTTTVDFVVTGIAPAPVPTFTVTASRGKNQLVWWNPSSEGFTATMIRFKTTGYPTGPTDGTLLMDQSGPPSARQEYFHTGLTNGVTYYYGAFAHFDDASNYYAIGTNASGRPMASADFDRDSDVDLEDFARFQMCYNGPNRPATLPSVCDVADMDADGDVDLTDFAVFQGCYNGPARPPRGGCAT